MSVLRVYDPPDCDERGYPLDWEQCRSCGGTGRVVPLDERGGPFGSAYRETYEAIVRDDARALGQTPESSEVMRERRTVCRACDGHGSLRAAALAVKTRHLILTKYDDARRNTLHFQAPVVVRCEGCGHPMSEGTWEGRPLPNGELPANVEFAHALSLLRQGLLDGIANPLRVYYSPCDEGCRHGCDDEGPTGLRWVEADPPYSTAGEPVPWTAFDSEPAASEGVGALIRGVGPVEASWRQVDVRTLGWPHDLRPEKLAVLCLRCYAARDSAAPSTGDGS